MPIQPKVKAGGLAGAATTLAIYFAGAIFGLGSEGISNEELGAAVATIAFTGAAWWKSNR